MSKPLVGLLFFVCLMLAAVYGSRNFYFDASADSLVAEKDPELLYYREVTRHFPGESYLFMTYAPANVPLFSPETLKKLDDLKIRLLAIDGVISVTTLLDVPLLKSPPVPLSKLATDYRTLRSPDVDLQAAFQELTSSPLYKELLISADGKTTALRIDLADDPALAALEETRNALRLVAHPTPDQRADLARINREYRHLYAANVARIDGVLTNIRAVRDSLAPDVVSYLGGVPMLAADMKHYIKSDVFTFGGITLGIMMLALYWFFRSVRWVVLPLVVAGVTVLLTVGLLGALEKPITVISSNFVSILLIMAVSIVVHLANQYREDVAHNPQLDHATLVHRAWIKKLLPSFYTALTAGVGFLSLVACSIIPVIDFGLIMTAGVGLSFLVAFLFLPLVLILLPKEKVAPDFTESYTPVVRLCHDLATQRTGWVLGVSVALSAVTLWGASLLNLNNRFIDYFDKGTEIYQGLSLIDRELGGTTPMEVVITFPPFKKPEIAADDDFFSASAEADPFPQRYWFTPDKIDILRRMEAYLLSRPEIGKTISLATLETIAQDFNDGRPLGAVELVAVLGSMPQHLRDSFIAPYAAPEQGYMRISTRIHETGPLFSREQLIADIETYATQNLGLAPGQVKVTGLNVLFNGMLRDLFSSQASTFLLVIGAMFLVFMVLMRSAKIALIAVVPNLVSSFLVQGFMGFAGLPLDMMTITIASIVMGMGLEDAIHYLHHFRHHRALGHDVRTSIDLCHRQIGRALYFTSVTVIVGFSVLYFSNFVPTVYFGLLTTVAITCALLANLTLLPALLLKFSR